MSLHLCDTNIWLALSIPSHVHNSAARRWLDGIDEVASILFCRVTQLSFLRLASTAAMVVPYGLRPLTNQQAWTAFERFVGDDRVAFQADEPGGLEAVWNEYTSRPTASPKLWMDAYLAAYARAAGYTLVTTDSAFRQFAGLDLLVMGDGSPS